MSPKLKVLHYMWSANFGGIEKLVIDLTRTQNQGDHVAAEILIGCNKGSFKEKLIDPLTPHSYAGLKNGFDFNPFVYSKTKAKMKKFDIIHFHTFNTLIFKAAVDSGKNIFYTIHGNFNLGRTPRINDHINNYFRKYYLNNSVDFISFNSK